MGAEAQEEQRARVSTVAGLGWEADPCSRNTESVSRARQERGPPTLWPLLSSGDQGRVSSSLDRTGVPFQLGYPESGGYCRTDGEGREGSWGASEGSRQWSG